MSTRLHILSWTAALVMAGSAWAQTDAQTQTPPGQSASPPGLSTGAPQNTMPSSSAPVPQEAQGDPYITDKEFVKSAAETSAIEVHLGKLAADKGSSDSVKQLGKRMVETHTQTGEQLNRAATALKLETPSDTPRKAKKAEDKLAKLSGSDFDKAYTKIAAEEQKQAVKQFEHEAKNGKIQGVKDFAAKALPAQQETEKRAAELASAAPAMNTKDK